MNRAFGPYLHTRAFVEVPSEARARFHTLAYQSPEFSLSFFCEGPDDLYAKVAPRGEPESSFYLGATLAFITGVAEPYLDKDSLAGLLPEKHDLAGSGPPDGDVGAA